VRVGEAAVITVEQIEESFCSANGAIAADLLRWFNELSVPAPWVKRVRVVFVRGFSDAE
jgi:hypothetical protein